MKVIAIKCSKCGDTIYSRARHDCRSCSCGEIHIDGGDSYTKISFPPDKGLPKPFELEIDTTKEELLKDYQECQDKFGRIKKIGVNDE